MEFLIQRIRLDTNRRNFCIFIIKSTSTSHRTSEETRSASCESSFSWIPIGCPIACFDQQEPTSRFTFRSRAKLDDAKRMILLRNAYYSPTQPHPLFNPFCGGTKPPSAFHSGFGSIRVLVHSPRRPKYVITWCNSTSKWCRLICVRVSNWYMCWVESRSTWVRSNAGGKFIPIEWELFVNMVG